MRKSSQLRSVSLKVHFEEFGDGLDYWSYPNNNNNFPTSIESLNKVYFDEDYLKSVEAILKVVEIVR